MRYALVLTLLGLAAAAPAQETLPYGSLAEYWKAVRALPPKAGSALIEPTRVELREFDDAMVDLVQGSSIRSFASRLEQLNYSLGILTDASSGKRYLMVSEMANGRRAWATS